MQPVNNLILNTNVAAADGPWRNIQTLVSSSVQFIAKTSAGLSTALTGTIWLEVSNDPTVNVDNLATQIAAPTAPTVTQFTPSTYGNADGATYTFPSIAYSVKLTYVNLQGETVPSSATVITPTAGNTIEIAAPGPDAGGFATGYNVYISIGGGAYVLQNPLYNSGRTFGNGDAANGPINVNQGFTLYALLTQGISAPVANTTGTPNVGTNITGNLNALAVTGTDNEASISYDTQPSGLWSASATMVMWAPSCLYFNWVRARVTGQTAGHVLQAYLFGQNG